MARKPKVEAIDPMSPIPLSFTLPEAKAKRTFKMIQPTKDELRVKLHNAETEAVYWHEEFCRLSQAPAWRRLLNRPLPRGHIK